MNTDFVNFMLPFCTILPYYPGKITCAFFPSRFPSQSFGVRCSFQGPPRPQLAFFHGFFLFSPDFQTQIQIETSDLSRDHHTSNLPFSPDFEIQIQIETGDLSRAVIFLWYTVYTWRVEDGYCTDPTHGSGTYVVIDVKHRITYCYLYLQRLITDLAANSRVVDHINHTADDMVESGHGQAQAIRDRQAQINERYGHH